MNVSFQSCGHLARLRYSKLTEITHMAVGEHQSAFPLRVLWLPRREFEVADRFLEIADCILAPGKPSQCHTGFVKASASSCLSVRSARFVRQGSIKFQRAVGSTSAPLKSSAKRNYGPGPDTDPRRFAEAARYRRASQKIFTDCSGVRIRAHAASVLFV